MIRNKKNWVSFVVLSLALIVALSGCMRSNEAVPQQTAYPGEATTTPTGTATPSNETVQDTFDWKTRANVVEKRINLFSEISDCRIVAMDQTALVGVKFTNQYKGEITERIRDMIAGEIMAADNRIQVVAVTAEPGDVATVFSLSDQLQTTGVNEEELRTQMDKIVKNTTTMR